LKIFDSLSGFLTPIHPNEMNMPIRKHFGAPHLSDRRGIITILSTLIVAAIGLGIAISLLLTSTDVLRTAQILTASHEARALADACAEHALNKLRLSKSYTGDELLTFPRGQCQINALTGTGNVRTITAQADVASSTRRVRIETSQLQPSLLLSTWQEIGEN
jgi:hypothetical protein